MNKKKYIKRKKYTKRNHINTRKKYNKKKNNKKKKITYKKNIKGGGKRWLNYEENVRMKELVEKAMKARANQDPEKQEEMRQMVDEIRQRERNKFRSYYQDKTHAELLEEAKSWGIYDDIINKAQSRKISIDKLEREIIIEMIVDEVLKVSAMATISRSDAASIKKDNKIIGDVGGLITGSLGYGLSEEYGLDVGDSILATSASFIPGYITGYTIGPFVNKISNLTTDKTRRKGASKNQAPPPYFSEIPGINIFHKPFMNPSSKKQNSPAAGPSSKK